MSSFKANYGGIGQLLVSPAMQSEMGRRIRKVRDRAKATAPFDPRDRDGNHYKDAFTVTTGVQARRTRRAVGTLTNDNSAAVAVEFGNRNTPKHATMRNALQLADVPANALTIVTGSLLIASVVGPNVATQARDATRRRASHHVVRSWSSSAATASLIRGANSRTDSSGPTTSGSPNRIVSWRRPGAGQPVPRGIAANVPRCATGTTGTPCSLARNAAPIRNLPTHPSVDRVPSG